MKLRAFTPASHQPHREDRALARGVLAGDEQSVREFMDIYFPRLHRFALARMSEDPAGAEDVVQQTLIIAARKMGTYRGEASLMAWLAQICRRELVRHIQKSRRRQQVVSFFDDEPLIESMIENIDIEEDSPHALAERSELVAAVHTVLDRLPNRNGDVLEWKYIEGLSIQEISERLGISTEAVQSQLARARRAFRQACDGVQKLNVTGST